MSVFAVQRIGDSIPPPRPRKVWEARPVLNGWATSRDERKAAAGERLAVPCEVITARQAAVVGILDAVCSTLLTTLSTRNSVRSPLFAPSRCLPPPPLCWPLLVGMGEAGGSDALCGRADEPRASVARWLLLRS